LQYEVLPFIQNMAEAYANADLIICRAGALTVTEVATAGVPAVFVPLPIAVDDHQTANAKYLANAGAALICQQAGMTSDSLAQALQPILNRSTLKQMAIKARQLAQPEATQDVSRIILSTIQAK
jgi:UDP-N-acetylglucosamine--N-acetylmuramyl-(pentapeptide) pyrophosphoryl-undecaprenol N-acetylglucosamine transferase